MAGTEDAARGGHVGPFRVVGRLGAGGMGEVLLGLGADGTLAAVKTIRPVLLHDESLRDRFRREIEAARAVESPYVARLLGGSAEARMPWLATEFVPGPTLADAVARGGPLPAPVVAGLGAHLAQALGAVHERGLLHRDLKPSNVLLAVDGPRLIDFGIARAADVRTLTATGAMIGTPGYMSPEQVAGARKVGPASDVFSLGALLVFAATGAGPFGDATAAVLLHRIVEGEAELGAIPEELRPALTACLDPDPAGRPAPAQLAAALEPLSVAGSGFGSGSGWPEPVLAMIEESRRAAHAATAPLAPTRPMQVQSGGQSAVTSPARKGRRSRTLALAGALAFLLSAGIAATARFGLGIGAPTAAGAPRSETSAGGQGADPLAALTAVTERGGPGADRVFPATPVRLPSGFHPWAVYLADQPTGCSLGRGVLVCRLVDGSLQAIDTADGHERWRVDPYTSGYPLDAPTTNDGQFLIPLDGEDPAISGNRVATVDTQGNLRIQDLTSGQVLSSLSFGANTAAVREPVADGDTLFFALCHERPGMGCDYTLDAAGFDGHQLPWHRAIGSTGIDMVSLHDIYSPKLASAGAVYVRSPAGLSAYDEKTGAPLGELPVGEGGCNSVAMPGSFALCRLGDGATLRVNPGTLSGSTDLSTLNAQLRDANTTVGAVVGRSTIVAQSGVDNSIFAVDQSSGATRWKLVVVAVKPDQYNQFASDAAPIVTGKWVATATPTQLLLTALAGSSPTATATTTALAPPAVGAPGPHATVQSFKGFQHPRVLEFDGLLVVVSGDGAVHAMALPQR